VYAVVVLQLLPDRQLSQSVLESGVGLMVGAQTPFVIACSRASRPVECEDSIRHQSRRKWIPSMLPYSVNPESGNRVVFSDEISSCMQEGMDGR